MINSTNSDYAITHENELAYVLSKFNSDFVYNTITESLNSRLRVYGYNTPNIVNAFEQNFIAAKSDFPDNIGQITDIRNDTYTNIIKMLCDAHQIVFSDGDGIIDLFSAASIMYSFLVSNFQKNIVTFFVNYILKEKTAIYDMLQLSNSKKNKDSSTIYSKKVFKNQKLGIISANLDFVVDSICNSFDIPFDTYIKYVYIEDNDVYKFLTNTLSPINDFFRTYIGSTFNSEFRPILLTSIRLSLQQETTDSDMNKLF